MQVVRSDSRHAFVRERALEWLRENPAAVELCLRYDNAFVRESAANAAGKLGRDDLVLRIAHMLDDGVREVETAAEKALERLGVGEKERELLKTVEQGRREREALNDYKSELEKPSANPDNLRICLLRMVRAKNRRIHVATAPPILNTPKAMA